MTTTEDRDRNGRKARGLRNEAAYYAESFDTDYVDTKHNIFTKSGRQKVTTKLLEGCHRAVYQHIKKESA